MMRTRCQCLALAVVFGLCGGCALWPVDAIVFQTPTTNDNPTTTALSELPPESLPPFVPANPDDDMRSPAFLAARQQSDPAFLTLLDAAQQQLDQEEAGFALALYAEAIDNFPTDPLVVFAILKAGWCYFYLGEPRKSFAQFEQAIRHIDATQSALFLRDSALQYLVKAFSLWDAGDPRKFQAYIRKFVPGDPEKEETLTALLAFFYRQAGNIRNEIFIYHRLMEQNPHTFKSLQYQINIVEALDAGADIEEVVAEYTALLTLYHQLMRDPLVLDQPQDVEQAIQRIKHHLFTAAQWYSVLMKGCDLHGHMRLRFFTYYKIYLENFVDNPLQRANEKALRVLYTKVRTEGF